MTVCLTCCSVVPNFFNQTTILYYITGISILIVVATILIGRFAAGLDWSQLYGLTGDM